MNCSFCNSIQKFFNYTPSSDRRLSDSIHNASLGILTIGSYFNPYLATIGLAATTVAYAAYAWKWSRSVKVEPQIEVKFEVKLEEAATPEIIVAPELAAAPELAVAPELAAAPEDIAPPEEMPALERTDHFIRSNPDENKLEKNELEDIGRSIDEFLAGGFAEPQQLIGIRPESSLAVHRGTKRKIGEFEEDPKSMKMAKDPSLAMKRDALSKDSLSLEIATNLGVKLNTADETTLNNINEIKCLVSELINFPEKYEIFSCKTNNRFVDRAMTGLSRDLQFDSNGDIWIYLDRPDRGDKILGHGASKRVTRALNIRTLEVCALSMFKKEGEDADIEMELTQLFQGDIEGIAETRSWVSFLKRGKIIKAFIQKEYPYSLLDKMKRLTFRDRCQVALDVATGLWNIHQLGICHMDIKPENVQLYIDLKGNVRAVLNDFNLSGPIKTPIFDSGTKGFTAPELSPDFRRPSSTAMDIYSLGKTFNELFAGIPSFSVADQLILKNMVNINPDRRPSADQILGFMKAKLEAIPV